MEIWTLKRQLFLVLGTKIHYFTSPMFVVGGSVPYRLSGDVRDSSCMSFLLIRFISSKLVEHDFMIQKLYVITGITKVLVASTLAAESWVFIIVISAIFSFWINCYFISLLLLPCNCLRWSWLGLLFYHQSQVSFCSPLCFVDSRFVLWQGFRFD